MARAAEAQLPAPPVVGAGPFQVGAYAGLTLSRPEHPEEVETAEVSELVAAMLAWGRISTRASYLVEMDMAKQTTETWTGRETDRRFDPVRMYLEYAASDQFRFRAGRFLTPFGHWNEHHAEPLTWTPTRPLTSYRPFAKSLTGLMVAGERPLGRRDAGYALFWAPFSGLNRAFEEQEESSFARVVGGRAAVELRPGLTIGASMALLQRSHPPDDELDEEESEEQEREEEHGRPVIGADLLWASARFEVSAEAAFLPEGGGRPREQGAFIQGAGKISESLWVVLRGEAYDPIGGGGVGVGYGGLTFRGGTHFVAKFGRQFTRRPSNKIPDGWFLSFSSLF